MFGEAWSPMSVPDLAPDDDDDDIYINLWVAQWIRVLDILEHIYYLIVQIRSLYRPSLQICFWIVQPFSSVGHRYKRYFWRSHSYLT